MLDLADAHSRAFPFAKSVTRIGVPSHRLDTICADLGLEELVLMKIDTQGAEEKVLRGAHKTLQGIGLIIIELSFVELYRSQPLFEQVYELLHDSGFRLRGIIDIMRDPSSGACLQVDAVFENGRICKRVGP